MTKIDKDDYVKVFVSQPMRDKAKIEILLERQKALDLISEYIGKQVVCCESYFADANPKTTKHTPLWWLGKSIQVLGEADIMVCTEGFADYRGCLTELFVAQHYGIPAYVIENGEVHKVSNVKGE